MGLRYAPERERIGRSLRWQLSPLIRFLLFFFQAEDGIRDYKVTGVQTCALPICSRSCRLVFLIPATQAASAPRLQARQPRAASLPPTLHRSSETAPDSSCALCVDRKSVV